LPNQNDLTVALAGFGAVGRVVAKRLDHGIPGLTLAAISARDRERAHAFMRDFRNPVSVEPLERLPSLADIVVECLPSALLSRIAEPALRAGRTLIVLSCGALLDHPQLRDLAVQYGGRIIVPTGALIGLDALQAAMEGVITSVRMVTRKPPRGLIGAPYLAEHGIDLVGLRAPLKLFSGSARDGVRGFPANVNVAAALSLAGIGPDQTIMEIWADPSLDRNTHVITVESDSANFSMSISNIPTEENPKTGKITALSVIATLRRLTAPVRIGT
jgi:aspartate dehydrogenase